MNHRISEFGEMMMKVIQWLETLGEPPGILLKNACAYTYLGISKSLDMRWGPVIYIFNMHSG